MTQTTPTSHRYRGQIGGALLGAFDGSLSRVPAPLRALVARLVGVGRWAEAAGLTKPINHAHGPLR